MLSVKIYSLPPMCVDKENWKQLWGLALRPNPRLLFCCEEKEPTINSNVSQIKYTKHVSI